MPLQRVPDMTASKYYISISFSPLPLEVCLINKMLIKGRYYLREWVHLPHESGDPTWRLELKLERVSGQASVNFLRNIPTPSQMDRSKICKEYEKQAVKETIEAGSTSSARRAEIVAPLAEILTDMAHPPPLDTRLLHPTGIGADATDEADPKDVGDTELRFEELFE